MVTVSYSLSKQTASGLEAYHRAGMTLLRRPEIGSLTTFDANVRVFMYPLGADSNVSSGSSHVSRRYLKALRFGIRCITYPNAPQRSSTTYLSKPQAITTRHTTGSSQTTISPNTQKYKFVAHLSYLSTNDMVSHFDIVSRIHIEIIFPSLSQQISNNRDSTANELRHISAPTPLHTDSIDQLT